MKRPHRARYATDTELLDRVRRLWEDYDPSPSDLPQRALVAIGMDDLELELLLLQDSFADLAGARGTATARTLTFSGEAVSVMVTITPVRADRFRLDGWVAPLGGGRVQARHSTGPDVDADVDREGRFVLDDVPSGLVQIVYHPNDVPGYGALDHRHRARSDHRGNRPVAAPPVRL
jgi:hypothetical protein